MSYELLADLTESHLIPSRPSLHAWDVKKLRQVGYLYFLALRILLGHDKTQGWAEKYCERTIHQNDFSSWRSDGNDLYVILYALISDDEFKDGKISTQAVRDWLHHVKADHLHEYTQKLFNRLDGMFNITDSSLKATRRAIMNWQDNDDREKESLLDKVIQKLNNLAPKSELLKHLKSLSTEFSDDLKETASTGATGAANVAAVVGGLGAGFAPDENWRSIYGQKKPIIIRRVPKSEKKT